MYFHSYDIPGLKKLENIEPGNGKSVYYNPYALPCGIYI